MNHEQRAKYVEDVLSSANCRAEAFHIIGRQLFAGKISPSDYFEMSDMLGFTIRMHEKHPIYQSLSKEYFRANDLTESEQPIQKRAAQA